MTYKGKFPILRPTKKKFLSNKEVLIKQSQSQHVLLRVSRRPDCRVDPQYSLYCGRNFFLPLSVHSHGNRHRTELYYWQVFYKTLPLVKRAHPFLPILFGSTIQINRDKFQKRLKTNSLFSKTPGGKSFLCKVLPYSPREYHRAGIIRHSLSITKCRFSQR